MAQGTPFPTNPASAVEQPRWWDAKTVALLQGALHRYRWLAVRNGRIEAKACAKCCSEQLQF